VLDYLADISDTAIQVHWPDLAAAGIEPTTPVTVTLKDATLQQALRVILDQASSTKALLKSQTDQGRILILVDPRSRTGTSTKPSHS
jgi:hypothetical protein